MRKLRLLFGREPKVDSILRRGLIGPQYRVCPKVRLADAIGPEPDEYLPERMFRYLSAAHLDFLVTRDDVSFFALEFDGSAHFHDPATIERDVLKNRACYAAKLPLLRVTSEHIVERDKLTLLDYMLSRIIAWPDEIESIRSEIESLTSDGRSSRDKEDLAVDLDPAFHFDLRHPFPLIADIRRAIWHRHCISYECDPELLAQNPRYFYSTQHVSYPDPRHGELLRSIVHITLRAGGAPSGEVLYKCAEGVTIHWALPLGDEPPPGLSPDIANQLTDLKRDLTGLGISVRLNFPWPVSLPGIDPHDISENYAEYLALRTLSNWALKHLENGV